MKISLFLWTKLPSKNAKDILNINRLLTSLSLHWGKAYIHGYWVKAVFLELCLKEKADHHINHDAHQIMCT